MPATLTLDEADAKVSGSDSKSPKTLSLDEADQLSEEAPQVASSALAPVSTLSQLPSVLFEPSDEQKQTAAAEQSAAKELGPEESSRLAKQISDKWDKIIAMASESRPENVAQFQAQKNAELRSVGFEPVGEGEVITPKTTPQDITTLTGIKGRPAKVLSAVASAPSSVAEGLLQPEGALMFTPGGAAGFVAQMAASVPAKIGEAAGAYSAGDTDTGDSALINAAVTAGMLVLPARLAKSKSVKLEDVVGPKQAADIRAQFQGPIATGEVLQTPKGARPTPELIGPGHAESIIPEGMSNEAGVPTAGIPAEPIPEIHAAPDVIQKIQANKIKSPIAVLRVFPNLNLTLEQAQDVLYQAWGKVPEIKPEDKQNASKITSSTSVSQPEVRPPVGESPPLRQPGETTGTPASPQKGPNGIPEEVTAEPATPQEISKQIGATFDAVWDVPGTPKLLQYTWRAADVPKDSPIYGATFYVRADDSPQVALAKATAKANEFGVKDYQPKQPISAEKPAVVEPPKTVPAAASETPAPEQSLTQPALIGMSGAVQSEFKLGQGSPTAMKYRLIDQERQQRGLPPLVKSESVSDQATMDRAMAAIDQDPALPEKLVNELNSKPRPIEDWENHVLLLHKIDLRNAYDKSARDAIQAYEDSKDFPDRKADMVRANIETARLSDQLSQLESASRVSGSARGRALRSLQVMANEDYSLASLETQRRAAKGGAPLTIDERAQLKKVADDYAKANADLQTHLETVRNKNSQLEAQSALDKIALQSAKPVEPHIRTLADKIISAMDTKANAALERIRARQAQGQAFSGPLNPETLDDLAIYGAAKIVKGVTEFGKWSTQMAAELGEHIKPYLKQIYDAANKNFDKQVSAVAGGDSPKVKRAVKTQPVADQQNAVIASIGKKFTSGKKNEITNAVQRLARLFVQEGVKDREELIGRVHAVLQSFDPTVTRRDAMDAISGYGDFKQLSKDEITVRLRGMKGEMQQISKLQDMADGIPPSKTGVERRTPTEAERKLIKAVNEAKIKFQVPITDPSTQLKSALDTRKTMLQNQITDFQSRLDNGDFASKPRRELVLDRKAQELQAKKDAIAKKFKSEQRKYQLANRPSSERFWDFLSNVRRFSVLSGVNVLAKLAAYSATKIPTMGATEAIGGVLSKLPKISQIAAKAPTEGAMDLKTLSRSVAIGLTKGFEDAWKTLRTGSSDLKKAFSPRLETGYEWYNIPQTIHEVIKSPLRRIAFENSLARRMQDAAKKGADITDPLTQLALSKDAYLDSDRALLLENNRLANGIRGLFKQLEQKDKATGEVPMHGKVAATIGRIEFPILTVPFNYTKQTLMSAFGLVSGSVKARAAFRRGIDTLKPEEADAIMRHLRYGTIGGAMLLYGFFDGYKNGANGTFGGYYQPGEKRKPNQAGVGGLKIGDQKIAGVLLHNPVIAVGQLGHTIGAIAASKIKKTGEQRGLTVGVVAGMMGLLNESPLGRQFELVSTLSSPSSANYAIGEHVKGILIPQLMNEAAQVTDKDAQGNVIKRNPKTIFQHVETGVPGLRQQVPAKIIKGQPVMFNGKSYSVGQIIPINGQNYIVTGFSEENGEPLVDKQK